MSKMCQVLPSLNRSSFDKQPSQSHGLFNGRLSQLGHSCRPSLDSATTMQSASEQWTDLILEETPHDPFQEPYKHTWTPSFDPLADLELFPSEIKVASSPIWSALDPGSPLENPFDDTTEMRDANDGQSTTPTHNGGGGSASGSREDAPRERPRSASTSLPKNAIGAADGDDDDNHRRHSQQAQPDNAHAASLANTGVGSRQASDLAGAPLRSLLARSGKSPQRGPPQPTTDQEGTPRKPKKTSKKPNAWRSLPVGEVEQGLNYDEVKGRSRRDLVLVDISQLYDKTQREAAELLGVSHMTVVRAWKQATRRRWPQRRILALQQQLAAFAGPDEEKQRLEDELRWWKTPVLVLLPRIPAWAKAVELRLPVEPTTNV